MGQRQRNLRRIVRVRPADSQAEFIIGADSACAAEPKDTSDGGGTWSLGGQVGRAWFRDPNSPMVVSAPGPVRSQPCGQRAILDLAVLTAGSARVLCADGLVRSTTGNGSAWTNVGTVDGAVALAVPRVNAAQTYVARGHPGLRWRSDLAGWPEGRDLVHPSGDSQASRSDTCR